MAQRIPLAAMLELRGISAGYGELQVLHEVNVKVHQREVVTIVGANGAGKTTLLKAISGLVPCTAGSLSFGGQAIHALAAHRRVDLGLIQIPESRRLFPFMTVRENIDLGCYTPKARKEKKSTLEGVLTLLPVLKTRLRQLAGTLSGGEQQMLAIARGLMARPQLLMLDEPTLGLAPRVIVQIFDTIRAINQQGVTIVLVEQNVRHALQLAHRGYVLENGRVLMEGAGDALLADERLKKAYLGL